VMQYFITGWGGLEELWKRRPKESPAPQQAHPSPSGGGTRAGEGQGKPPHSP
jgi:hypothetical protein